MSFKDKNACITISDIPVMVLEEVLSHLPTKEILHCSRLTSSTWNEAASRLCRARLVKFRSTFENLEFCNIALFPNVPNLSWSSIEFKFTTKNLSDMTLRSLSIAEVFGSKIRKLDIDCCDVPNNSELIRHLQRLLNLLPNLQSLSLDLPFISSIDFFSIVQAIMVSSITKLNLIVAYDGNNSGWELLQSQKKISVLELSVYSNRANITENHFQSLELCMTNCSKLLKLELNGFFTNQTTELQNSYKLTLPPFTSLKELEICLFPHKFEIEWQKKCIHFNALDPDKCPSLSSVTLRIDRVESYRLKIDVHSVFGAAGTPPFKRVTYLRIVGRSPGPEKWVERFPNVIQLVASVEKPEMGQEIVHNFPNLSQLLLCFFDGSINSKLLEIFKHLPSLRGLTALFLENKSRNDVISDPGAILCMLLHPMQLTLRQAQLSESCIQHLQQYHLKFEYVPLGPG